MVPPSRRPARKPAAGDAATPTFEERLAALEAVVDALEAEDLGLEESLARYREGVAHLEACRALLDDAEARLVELTQNSDGRVVERPLEVGEGGLEDVVEEE